MIYTIIFALGVLRLRSGSCQLIGPVILLSKKIVAFINEILANFYSTIRSAYCILVIIL